MIPTVNKIYLQYRAKKLTRNDTESLLLAEIFNSPKYYGLVNPSEDDISNFLLWIHQYIPIILEKYNPTESTFLTYFTTAIRLRYRSWKRQIVKEKVLQEILDNYHYQESLKNEEYYIEVAELEPTYLPSCSQELQPRYPLSTIQATTVLVLALRSIHSLSSKVLSHTSRRKNNCNSSWKGKLTAPIFFASSISRNWKPWNHQCPNITSLPVNTSTRRNYWKNYATIRKMQVSILPTS